MVDVLFGIDNAPIAVTSITQSSLVAASNGYSAPLDAPAGGWLLLLGCLAEC